MICPKCGFEQPDGVECMRCGVIISRYKGPVAGAAAPRSTPHPFAPGASPLPPPFISPPPVNAGGAVHAPIPPPPSISPAGTGFGDSPANPAGGTVYGGPPPPPAGSGTVYGGPGSIAPAFSSFGPGFHGTFEAGKILSEAFSIYFTNFIPFILLSTLALSPLLLFSAWASTVPVTEMVASQGNQLLGYLIQVLCVPIATAAITYGVYQQMRGASPSIAACLKVGLSTLFPLLGLAIVQGFAMGCSCFLVIPWIFLSVVWAVSIPAKVEEGMSVTDAMGRSYHLTEGYRWQVLGVLAVLFVVNLVLIMGMGLVVGVSSVRSGNAVHPGRLQFLTSLLAVVTTGLSATASAVMYYRLRSVKESIDVDHISSVFA
jgi:hypothetical protein